MEAETMLTPVALAAGVVPRLGVVLAAGRSERLHAVTGGGSKALVRLGGLTLVERAVRTLLGAGVRQVVVVVGYHAGPVAAVLARTAPGRVRPVVAEDWELGNGASLAAAEPAVGGEELFALLVADHVFGEDVLVDLLTAGEPAVLVDPSPSPEVWNEGMRVRIHRGRVLAFGKDLQEEAVDCGAFLLPREVFRCVRDAASEGDHSLSGAVTRLAATRPLRAVPVRPGGWWQDIDTPGDLHRARRLLRRSLVRQGDGPVSRYLNRPVSTRLSMALSPLRLPPDLLSLLALALGILAAWTLGAGRAVLGAVLAHLASVVDGVDGETARLQLRADRRGALLDGVLDRVADAAIVAGLGVWSLGDGTDPPVVLLLAVAAAAGAMLSMATKDRVTALGLPPAPERALGYLLAGRDGRLLLVAVWAALGHPVQALASVAVASGLALVLRVSLVRAAAREPTA